MHRFFGWAIPESLEGGISTMERRMIRANKSEKGEGFPPLPSPSAYRKSRKTNSMSIPSFANVDGNPRVLSSSSTISTT